MFNFQTSDCNKAYAKHNVKHDKHLQIVSLLRRKRNHLYNSHGSTTYSLFHLTTVGALLRGWTKRGLHVKSEAQRNKEKRRNPIRACKCALESQFCLNSNPGFPLDKTHRNWGVPVNKIGKHHSCWPFPVTLSCCKEVPFVSQRSVVCVTGNLNIPAEGRYGRPIFCRKENGNSNAPLSFFPSWLFPPLPTRTSSPLKRPKRYRGPVVTQARGHAARHRGRTLHTPIAMWSNLEVKGFCLSRDTLIMVCAFELYCF